jgi:hypothetical protein
MYIVSANYRNRYAKSRWLVRKVGQKPEEALEYKSVAAKGVTFRDSDAYEQGFGCSTVAYCESAVGDTKGFTDGQRLRFDRYMFIDPNGNYVEKVAELALHPDGSMISK